MRRRSSRASACTTSTTPRRCGCSRRADSAIGAPVPMHPSYEDREGAPDVLLAAVPAELAEHLSSVWEGPFRAAGADRADVFHLHHLTPQHDAVRRCWPAGCRRRPPPRHRDQVPRGGQRAHGPRQVGGNDAGRHARMGSGQPGTGSPQLDDRQRELLRSTRWEQWAHGEAWRDRLRRQADAADHLVVVSPADRATAVELLGVDAERVSDVPNGVDVIKFRPRPMSRLERRAHFRRWLVEDRRKAGTRPPSPARSPTARPTSTGSWAPTATPSC